MEWSRVQWNTMECCGVEEKWVVGKVRGKRGQGKSGPKTAQSKGGARVGKGTAKGDPRVVSSGGRRSRGKRNEVR